MLYDGLMLLSNIITLWCAHHWHTSCVREDLRTAPYAGWFFTGTIVAFRQWVAVKHYL